MFIVHLFCFSCIRKVLEGDSVCWSSKSNWRSEIGPKKDIPTKNTPWWDGVSKQWLHPVLCSLRTLRLWFQPSDPWTDSRPPEWQTSVWRMASVQNSPEETFIPCQVVILVTFIVSVWTWCPLDFVWFVCSTPLKTHTVFWDRLHSFWLKAPFIWAKKSKGSN